MGNNLKTVTVKDNTEYLGGIPDRYDNDFKDSDYFESTYDVEDNLHSKEETAQKSEEKPSILGQIRAYQEESKTEEKQKTKEQEILR